MTLLRIGALVLLGVSVVVAGTYYGGSSSLPVISLPRDLANYSSGHAGDHKALGIPVWGRAGSSSGTHLGGRSATQTWAAPGSVSGVRLGAGARTVIEPGPSPSSGARPQGAVSRAGGLSSGSGPSGGPGTSAGSGFSAGSGPSGAGSTRTGSGGPSSGSSAAGAAGPLPAGGPDSSSATGATGGSGTQAGGAPSPSSAGTPAAQGTIVQSITGLATAAQLTLLKTIPTTHGNAAHLAWSDDGSAVFLANEEGAMSAVRIAVTGLSQPTIAATSGQTNYLWAVAQRSGLLVFQPSVGGGVTLRLDPVTLQIIWSANTGPTHEIETDGSRVFVPAEGTPGTLIVLNSSGSQTASVPAPDGWANIYGIDYDAPTHRLYISSGADAAHGVLGGLYIYDVSQMRPVYQGKIPQPSSDVTVSGTRLWRQRGTTLEAWDVSNPQSPVMIGSWASSVVTGPGGTPVHNVFGSMAVNSSGTRLYVTYMPVTAAQGNQVLDWPSGFMIFDVSNAIPRPLTQQSWAVNAPYYEQPLAVALSPNQATLAVSYWAFGVRFYSVAGDTVTALGTVATTGEAHDVYVDNQGILYVFAHDDIQVLDPVTGHHIQDIPIVGMVVDGGWRPFRDGNIIVPGPSATIMKLAGGGLQFSQGLPGFGNFTWSVVFDGTTYLYQGDETGRVHVDKVSLAPAGTYNVVEVGTVQVSGSGSGGNPLLSMALQGTNLWVIGPNVGVAAVDVSTPSAPRVIYRDPFTFTTNGSHAGLVIAQNTVYAGVGATGVRIYNPFTFQKVGAISGFNVNFLDVLGNNYLVLANYWYAANPDGVYLFRIAGVATDPDSPVLVGWFPQPHGNANFRARAVGNIIYRVPLYGVDALQGPPVALTFGHPRNSYGINTLGGTWAIDCPHDWCPRGFPGHCTIRPVVINRRRADANDI